MRIQVQTLAVILAAALIFGSTAQAQDVRVKKNDDTKELDPTNGTKVEIRVEDGRVWINGEEVPEDVDLNEYLKEHGLDDVHVNVDGRVRFGRDAEGKTLWLDRDFDGDELDDDSPFGRVGNLFFRRDGTGGNALGFGDEDGAPRRFLFKDGGSGFSVGDIDFEFDDLASFGTNEIMGFLASSPEIMKKEQESRRLARRIGEADASERANLERKLDTLLNEIFDAKMDLRRQRVDKLAEKLQKEQDALDARLADREDIVARRKAELLGNDDRFDW
jgi:hypothetical protein